MACILLLLTLLLAAGCGDIVLPERVTKGDPEKPAQEELIPTQPELMP
ncbi:MAG: hypothetical protein J5478_04595 [Bacteroidales bacterium]|nr:hypothetical protein [Bacteroidales bacterium]MBR6423503.1 hypothetical protein [Bacteroidales bacterium]